MNLAVLLSPLRGVLRDCARLNIPHAVQTILSKLLP